MLLFALKTYLTMRVYHRGIGKLNQPPPTETLKTRFRPRYYTLKEELAMIF